MLISNLREDSRRKLTNISKETGIPISSLFDSLKLLKEDIIIKSTVLIDFYNIGFRTRTQTFLKVNKKDKERLIRHLQIYNGVNSIYKTNNKWDFIIETVHKNIREFDDFLEHIDQNFELERQEVHHLIKDIKKEAFMIQEK